MPRRARPRPADGARATVPDPLPVLRLSDGRRGHDNQSLGLVEALHRLRPVECRHVRVTRGIGGAARVLREPRVAAAARLAVAAGHGTHLALVAAARRSGARSVVLMKPSLPRALFDLCIVPRHDGVAEGGNVLTTLGVLNRVQPAARKDPHQALILLGGPSRHHAWDDALLREQITALTAADGHLDWQAATSPRTPPSTLPALAGIPGLRVVPFAATTAGWLPDRLASAARVWVTEDSVSMAYEAASSGAATGILPVPPRRSPGRVQAAVGTLIRAGHAMSFSDWQAGREPDGRGALQEAARCARALLERWPDLA